MTRPDLERHHILCLKNVEKSHWKIPPPRWEAFKSAGGLEKSHPLATGPTDICTPCAHRSHRGQKMPLGLELSKGESHP
ncbi:hypothetical protein STEG23_018649, partial [Scotinomys teguina]